MTEDATRTLPRLANTLAGPVILAIAGLVAYTYQQARAHAYTQHFGVHHDAGDPRQAVVVFALIALVVATVLWTLLASVKVAAVLSVPGTIVAFLVLAPLVPPYGWRNTAARVVVVVAIWAVVRAGAWAVSRGLAALRQLAAHPRGQTVVDRMDEVAERYDRAAVPMRPFVILAAAAGFVVGAWYAGGYTGRFDAAARRDFDVVGRQGSTVTVIFTTRGDIVERDLNIAPGPDGRPRNEWLPEVRIRPMPETGITYTTVRLGPTRPSEVAPAPVP